jgi:hypothetical protein
VVGDGNREHNGVDIEEEVVGVIATLIDEQERVRVGLDEVDGGQVGGKANVPCPRRLLEAL